MTEIVLDIKNLTTYFYTYAGTVRALEGVNLKVERGKTLGIVGETGCGKSVMALSILRLIPDPPGKIVGGEILFEGQDLLKLSEDEIKKIRGNKIAMVFQDPMTYLNPVMTIGDQIVEVILLHTDMKKRALEIRKAELEEQLKSAYADRQTSIYKEINGIQAHMLNPPSLSRWEMKRTVLHEVLGILKLVRMPYPEKVIDQYPHQLSGGMRQRAMIAMGLACKPSLLIADEATTSLDVTIQAQILQLLNDLRLNLSTSIVLITHDLGIIAEMCDAVAVMYAGVIVEYAYTDKLFANPLHPYTQGLLKAIPSLTVQQRKLETIAGTVPNLVNPPNGCRFHPRCPFAFELCRREKPSLITVERNHQIACHLCTGR
jgi:oligopeptide/dipeptide ABC transporter ATP-binding protein